MQSQRILVIDDEEDIRDCVRLIVAREGKFDFDEACDGKEGLHKILTGTYDCIISDIKMPGLDGISMLKKMRAAGKHIPILFISAFADDEFEYRVTDFGAVKLIHKVDIKDIGMRIKEALKVGEDTRELTGSHQFGEDFLNILNNTGPK